MVDICYFPRTADAHRPCGYAPAIVILLLALLASLLSGLVFLLRDRGSTRRTVNSLGVRLVLAALAVRPPLGRIAPLDPAVPVPGVALHGSRHH